MTSKRKRRSIWQNEKKAYPFLLPGLLGTCVLVLVPFADVAVRSFQTAPDRRWTGFSNYQQVLTNDAFRLAVRNSFRFVAVCLPALVGLGLLIALLLHGMMDEYDRKHTKGGLAGSTGIVKSMLLFPMAMPTATVVLVWQLLFSKGGFLAQLTGYTEGFLDTGASFWILVVSYVWKNLGYTVVLWLAGIQALPKSLWEAAKVDGAGEPALVFRVLLPNLRGVLFTIVVLSFINSFRVFREAYLVAGAYPQEDIYLLQHLFQNWFVKLELNKMAAAAVLTGGFLFLFIMLFDRLWEGSGTKG